MSNKYNDLTRDQLISLFLKCDLSRSLGLVREQDEIAYKKRFTTDFPQQNIPSERQNAFHPVNNPETENRYSANSNQVWNYTADSCCMDVA